MRTPDLSGQYRQVEYSDEGCYIYQCLWCLGTIEIRDNPQYGWNFCPKCGKSWFTKKYCRPRNVPRWYWDHFGDPEDDPSLPPVYSLYKRQEPTNHWVIEWRTNWCAKRLGEDWGDWHLEERIPHRPHKQTYLYVYRRLKMLRADRDDDGDSIKFEYRARLEEK